MFNKNGKITKHFKQLTVIQKNAMYKFIDSVKCNGSFDLHEQKKEVYLKMQPLLVNFGQNNK